MHPKVLPKLLHWIHQWSYTNPCHALHVSASILVVWWLDSVLLCFQRRSLPCGIADSTSHHVSPTAPEHHWEAKHAVLSSKLKNSQTGTQQLWINLTYQQLFCAVSSRSVYLRELASYSQQSSPNSRGMLRVTLIGTFHHCTILYYR